MKLDCTQYYINIFFDEKNFEDTYSAGNELATVYRDGDIVKSYSLADVRNRLHGGKF